MEHDQRPTNLRQLRKAIVPACETLDQQIIQNAFEGMVNFREHISVFDLKEELLLMNKLLQNYFIENTAFF